jgi:hypothetical protein
MVSLFFCIHIIGSVTWSINNRASRQVQEIDDKKRAYELSLLSQRMRSGNPATLHHKSHFGSHINSPQLIRCGFVEAIKTPDFFEFGEDGFGSQSRLSRTLKVEHDLAADHHDETIS